MGIDTFLRISLRIAFFAVFASLVWVLTDKLMDFVPTNLGLNGCVGFFAVKLHLAENLALFFKIIVIGFVGKQLIAYIRNII